MVETKDPGRIAAGNYRRDEFQEYFVQEDRVSQNAAVLLDRIVRQGRAFGIHVILASQTLGGTYALARATLGQMAVRIAFHCDEADAYLIMGDDNPATTADPTWQPLSSDPASGRHFSPPFPAYVSGHATFAGAHAAVLRGVVGTDNVSFEASTDDPNVPAGTVRTFQSFGAAARENAASRVYLGVHFRWDGDHGVLSGTALGDLVVATRLRLT